MSQEAGIPLLGSIPIHIDLRKGGDTGAPRMVSVPSGKTGAIFEEIAEKITTSAAESAGPKATPGQDESLRIRDRLAQIMLLKLHRKAWHSFSANR